MLEVALSGGRASGGGGRGVLGPAEDTDCQLA